MRSRRLSVAVATTLVVGLISAVVSLVGIDPAQAAETFEGGTYTPLPPDRILDTRNDGFGAPNCVSSTGHVLQVSGPVVHSTDGTTFPTGTVVPTTAAAVVLNVTAVDAGLPGWVTVWPGGTQPTASSLNYVSSTAVTNQVIARLDDTGKIKIASSAGCPQIVVDVLGWFTAVPVGTVENPNSPVPGGFKATNPVTQPPRVMDTRVASDPNTGCLTNGTTKEIDLTNVGGIPAENVKAAALNVTVVNPTAQGWVTVYPKGELEPNVSNVNYVANQTVPNSVIIKLGFQDRVVFAGHGDCPHLVVDVVGWFQDGAAGVGAFEELSPKRLLDTRPGATGVEPGAPTGACVSTERKVKVVGRGGVPALDSPKPPTAVAVNVTATDAQGAGFLTVWPTGSTKPFTSALNYKAGANATPNMVISKVGPDGEISLATDQGCPHVLIDVVGYFVAPDPALTSVSPQAFGLLSNSQVSVEKVLTVTNASAFNDPSKPVFTFLGPDAAGFSTMSNTCPTGTTGLPNSGGAAQSCTVTVKFQPVGGTSAITDTNAQLVITSGLGVTLVELDGTRPAQAT